MRERQFVVAHRAAALAVTKRAGSKHTFGFLVAAAIFQCALGLQCQPLKQPPWDDGRGDVATNGEADATRFK